MSLVLHRIQAGESFSRDMDTEYVERCLSLIENNDKTDYHKVASQLSTIISEGINGVIEVRIVPGYLVASILPPDLTLRHPLINSLRNHNYSGKEGIRALSEVERTIGSYNPTTGKLSGALSKLVGVINISEDIINGKILTPAEGLAIICHEIGHHCGYCAAVGTMVRGNVAVAAATKQLLEEESRVRKLELLKTITRITESKIEPEDAIALSDTTDENLVTSVVSVSAADSFRSKFGSSMYDNEAYEQIADNYSARCGLSAPLGTALVKIHKAYGCYETLNSASFIAVEVLKVMILLIILASNPLQLFVFYFSSRRLFNMKSEYPTLKQRLNKLINDGNASLARKGITKEERARLISSVDELKRLRDDIPREHGPISALYTWVHSSHKSRSVAKEMRALEELTNNSLYTSAARIAQSQKN